MGDTKQISTRTEHSAGGVVIRHLPGQTKVLVMKDSHGRWSFPKGRLEAGESALDAARRETREEVGIEQLDFLCDLGTSDFWFMDRWEQPGQRVHKLIEYFLFLTQPEQAGDPQEPERVQRVHWVSAKELRGLIQYKSLRPIVERAVAAIEQLPKSGVIDG